jgi:hypothetical protein
MDEGWGSNIMQVESALSHLLGEGQEVSGAGCLWLAAVWPQQQNV